MTRQLVSPIRSPACAQAKGLVQGPEYQEVGVTGAILEAASAQALSSDPASCKQPSWSSHPTLLLIAHRLELSHLATSNCK